MISPVTQGMWGIRGLAGAGQGVVDWGGGVRGYDADMDMARTSYSTPESTLMWI